MKELPADRLYRTVHALIVTIQNLVEKDALLGSLFKMYVPRKEWDDVIAALNEYYKTRKGTK